MKMRFLSVLLMVFLVFGLFSLHVFAIDGDPLSQGDGQVDHVDDPDDEIFVGTDITIDDLRISPEGLEMIKDLEGCVNTPMWDVSQMSIGYGCSTVYAEKYGFSTSHLSDEEAEQLLLCVLGEFEKKLEKFEEEHGLKWNQSQWDSLVSFTYNVGSSWLKPSYRLAGLLIDGDYTVNEFASAMGVWCHEGEKVSDILVVRRIREIKLFLYDAYELDDTANKFCTLKYEASGGEREVDIAFYLEDSPYEILFSAEHEDGLHLQGWFTLDGTQITKDTVVTDDITVYARWGNEVPSEPEPVPVEMSFTDVKEGDWYYGYLEDLYSRGVIDGYPDGSFRPNQTVTTGEALKMILLAAGYETPAPVASHWARNFLNLSLDEGIIDRGDIRDLDIPMTRAMMAKVVVNALGLARLTDGDNFTDTDIEFAEILFDHGLSDGYGNGTFGPGRSLTRAELATMVCRMYELQ